MQTQGVWAFLWPDVSTQAGAKRGADGGVLGAGLLVLVFLLFAFYVADGAANRTVHVILAGLAALMGWRVSRGGVIAAWTNVILTGLLAILLTSDVLSAGS